MTRSPAPSPVRTGTFESKTSFDSSHSERGRFEDNFVNGDSSSDKDEIDLARALGEGSNASVNQGNTRDDCVRGTGLFEINSLNDARKRMGQEIYNINDEKISYKEFMKEGPKKENDSAFGVGFYLLRLKLSFLFRLIAIPAII